MPGVASIAKQTPISPRYRLAAVEPLIPIGVALHAAALLAFDVDAGVWQWAAVGVTVALGLAGLLGVGGQHLMLLRGIAVVAMPWVVVPYHGGSLNLLTVWLVIAAVAYPIVLAAVIGRLYPILCGVSFLGLSLLPAAGYETVETLMRMLLLVGGGSLVWMLASSSVRLEDERQLAQQEAEAAKSRFRMAFANASPGMAVISSTGDVIEANRSLADLVHRPLDRLQSQGWSAFIHPEDFQLVVAQVGQLGAEGIWSFQQSVRCVRPRGEVVWCLLGVSLATDEAGENPYLFAQFQDINDLVHTEQRLRVSEEHYRNLFGHSPVAVLEQDFTAVGAWLDELREAGVDDLRDHLRSRPDLVKDGVELIRVGNVNDATMQLLEAGGRAGLVDGLPREMLTEQMIEAIVEQFVAVWEGRDRAEASAVSATMQGRRLDLVVHWVSPVVDARLDLSQVVVALADVTEYRRTQEALRRIEERLRTVVGAAPIILFAVDRYGIFTLAEGQGLSALGLRSGEAVGRSVFEMFRDSPQFVAAVRRSLSGEGFATSVEITGLDFDTRFTPIWDGTRVEGVVGVAYDITERKRAQERLEELIRSKDEFVASVSHELRTPLTAVVGFAQELQASLEEYGPEERALLVSLIADQSLEVADLVEDLLVAARVDLDRVAVAAGTVNLVDELRSVLAAWQPAEAAARVGIDGLDVMVHADAIRLRQIIRNLLSNAKRYGGEHIDVVVGEIEGFVSVMVQDDGPGVPPRDRERIFEPYHRAHRLEGQPASVGLGLTVSRHLARLMGGDLSYRYQDDRSIFELLLMPALSPQVSVGSSADVLPSLDASAAPGAEPD